MSKLVLRNLSRRFGSFTAVDGIDLSEEGNFEVLAALGTILLVVTLIIAAIGFRIIGRDFMLRRSVS